ncbi:hypothetical protein CS022_13600 [Veronia nyctiphanis]|uniref:VWFA domain-containing protein n=1 Tax=Veronia nyctiphanis TaxID=1278244 RepID=A0A4Q0YPC7_9GAMM|nr:DUF1318 domain-containing protein [Veronia nyctiphanis]RXJ72877.1 hypothetical protein CS022_13600 [Veronia nyctiphanis]
MSTGKISLSNISSVCGLGLMVMSTQSFASNYSDLMATMQVRQPDLERQQLLSDTCLGERLNGYLKINHSCPADVKQLAEDENNDRKALYTLMAKSLDNDLNTIGVQFAQKRHPFYVKGVMREIRLEDGSTTFWNGVGNHPDQNRVSRVLTKQYAKLYTNSNSSSDVVRDNLPLYEAFGVVKQENIDGNLWFHVTEEYVPKQKPANWQPKTIGWISADDVIPWKRALVMRFTNTLNREPSVFFETAEDAVALIKASTDNRTTQLDKLYTQFETGTVNKVSGALAIEPTVGQKQEQIVMYPLLDFYESKSDGLYMDGQFTRLLEVAAQTRNGSNDGSLGRLPVDIVFAMDLTSSMKPYLERLLSVVENFALDMDGQDIKFGFVGYQDKNKNFDYTVKQFTPNGVMSPPDFVKVLSKIEARKTPVKSDDIPEAVMNGVNTALESNQWRDNSLKLLVLIGDAPGREDSLFNVRALRDKANVRKIPIFSLYIDSSKGAAKHSRRGKKQYTELSSTYEGAYGTSRQIPHISIIDGGSTQKFAKTVSNSLNEARVLLANLAKSSDSIKLEQGSVSELLFQQANIMLADPSMPEDSIQGWVSDKVMKTPAREALAPMILLNEAELNELEQRVRELKTIGEMAMRGDSGTTLDFFDLVSDNTRFTIVDPSAVNFRDAFSAPLGINSLPYESDIMSTTREEFHSMDRVQTFVRSMDNKIRHYEDLKRQQGNPNVWKKLSSGTSERDRVVGVELNQLP